MNLPMRLLTLLEILFLAACGLNAEQGARGGLDQATGTDDPLARLAFTGGILQSDSRLLGYSRQTGRLSLVDPLQPAEVWGASLPGYDFAVAHPDLHGASVFAPGRVSVVDDRQGRRDFTLPLAYAHVASAAQAVAYSLAADDGAHFMLLRFLGAGQWQQETLSVPWADSLAVVGSLPVNQPVLLASVFDASATLLVVFAPADGRYAVYQAADTGSTLNFTGKACAGNGLGNPEQAYFRSLEWDEDRRVFYLGDIHGRIYAVDPLAACVDWQNPPVLALANTTAVSRITVYEPGQLAVTQSEGPLTLVNYDTGGFATTAGPYSTGCRLPFGALPAGTEHLLVFCVGFDSRGQAVAPTTGPGDPNIDPARYLLLRRADGGLSMVATEDAPTAGIAVDSGNAVLYRLFAGAFGRFESIDLLTGERRLNKGLFIPDLLH